MRLFVPGRICLFGEHSDWAGGYRPVNPQITKGYAIITGLDQGIHAQVGAHPDSLVLTATAEDGSRQGPNEIPMRPEALLAEAQGGGFWSYIAGVAYRLQALYPVKGLRIDNDRTDLPVKKGLSSSAAISVLTARAFNRVYDLHLTTREEMEIAYQGEITTPSRCGRMDQGCAFGSRPLLMVFDGDRLQVRRLHAHTDLHLAIVDLQAEKNTRQILSRLNRSFPFGRTEIDIGVRKLLGPINRRVIGEAVRALRASDAERLGHLMNEAQDLFDRFAVPACPEELRSPALHRLLQYKPLRPHIWGGKGVGSQGDGAAQLIARSADDRRVAINIIERELGLPCLELTLGRE